MVKATGWLTGLQVTADGTGVVSHAGVALIRALADNIGLTGGLSKALATDRLLVHDRGRVAADLACAIADGAEVISDFRVIGDQAELFGLAASVPTAWRTLDEIARGGQRTLGKVTAAVNTARRRAWAAAITRHGALPGVRVADKTLAGVTCIRLDASVVTCHSDKEGAEPNFKGFGMHPLLAYCDNTTEPLAGMLRPGSAGSNTTADHLAVLEAAITALPPAFRRRLMVTVDGAGASHGLIERLDTLAARPGYQVIYSVGWELGERERAAITAVPAGAWQIAVDGRGEVRERRATGACADPGCAHRRCWVEDAIRTGKNCGIGKYPSTALAMNKAWQAAALTAATLLAWLKLLALDGPLARAEPKTLRYRILHAAARLTRGGRRRRPRIAASWPWAADITTAWDRISALPQAP
jgi:hypothetical protein